MRLINKGIVVIGGTSGLGLSAALAFIREGAKVVVVGRNDTTGDEACKILGVNARVLIGDASNSSTALSAIDFCINEFGTFDGLYHVAGGSGRKMGDGPLHELTLEGWDYTFSLNLTSLMLSNQAAVKSFLAHNKSGSILNMGSVLGFSPSPKFFVTHAYAAAKSAVVGFTKSIASYYAKDNIRINLLAPALVDTPMSKRASENDEIQSFIKSKQPLDGGRNGLPQDLDGAAIFFLSDESRFATGQTLYIDGGWEVSEGQWV
jgi:NAD(P)-dependent dehydrogenase (short-subunit alcohol dehydrogenase family)